jgi:hypothetical protein
MIFSGFRLYKLLLYIDVESGCFDVPNSVESDNRPTLTSDCNCNVALSSSSLGSSPCEQLPSVPYHALMRACVCIYIYIYIYSPCIILNRSIDRTFF